MSEPTIETFDLRKSFGARTVVDNLNLKVYPGELYALLGDNGAGKTTSIGMLTTLIKPSSGTYKVCGYDGLKLPEKVKGCFGIVSQDVAIYHELTAYENLKFIADLHGIASDIAKSRILDLLKRADLLERMNDRAGQFSGGMQRKLTIASALLHAPKVLFMDEPTVGLDPAARRQIWTTLKDLKASGVTILLTTHYLEEAELLADRIGIIRSGRIVAEGTIEQLRHKIRAIRNITIRLTDPPDDEKLGVILNEVKTRFGADTQYDALRNTISLTQHEDGQLVESLDSILGWLAEREISFSRFGTNEPTLEEVFLAISQDLDQSVVSS